MTPSGISRDSALPLPRLYQTRAFCLTLISVAVGVAANCNQHYALKPVPPENRNAPAANSISTDSSTAPMLTTYAPGVLQYQIQQVATVEESSPTDSTRRVDSTRISGVLSLTLSHEHDTVKVNLQLDSGSVTVAGETSIALPQRSILTARITKPTNNVKQLNKNPDACFQNQADIGVSGIELIPTLQPISVETWVDTVETHLCRGGVLLNVTRIQHYKHDLSQPLSVVRNTSVAITGTGYQWGQRAGVTGEGIAVDTLTFIQPTRRIQGVSGTSQLMLTFTSLVRRQQFKQVVSTQFSLLQ